MERLQDAEEPRTMSACKVVAFTLVISTLVSARPLRIPPSAGAGSSSFPALMLEVARMAGGGFVAVDILRKAWTTRLPAANAAGRELLMSIGMNGMERLSSTTRLGWSSPSCSIVATIWLGSKGLATITLSKTSSAFSLWQPRASTTCNSLWRHRSPDVSK